MSNKAVCSQVTTAVVISGPTGKEIYTMKRRQGPMSFLFDVLFPTIDGGGNQYYPVVHRATVLIDLNCTVEGKNSILNGDLLAIDDYSFENYGKPHSSFPPVFIKYLSGYNGGRKVGEINFYNNDCNKILDFLFEGKK